LFFPEGTSTDGLRVLPFRTTLFAALTDSRETDFVQPVTLVYVAPGGERADFYGWWGDMSYGGHLLRMLAAQRHGRVELLWHEPIAIEADVDRKSLARRSESAVRGGLDEALAKLSRLSEGG
jgi:1-acyl-sn-glycerol-3-phosphate acyltransferase